MQEAIIPYNFWTKFGSSEVQTIVRKADDFLSVLIGKHRRKIYFGKSAVCLKLLNTVYNFPDMYLRKLLPLPTVVFISSHQTFRGFRGGRGVDCWNRKLEFQFCFQNNVVFLISDLCPWLHEMKWTLRNSCWKLKINLNILLLY